MEKIRIGIMVDSDSDLKSQCLVGLQLLQKNKSVEVVAIITASIHRNTKEVLFNIEQWTPRVDIWIVGAGWANHLTGTAEAYLRYALKSTIPVIGVAFTDGDNVIHNEAARLSVTEVPGTQVIWQDALGQFIGPYGFERACKFAANGKFPKIELKEPKPVQIRTLQETLEFIEKEKEGVKKS
jgi:phosphoribosylcarboxyaminoimidazole (NCAIR) mutase